MRVLIHAVFAAVLIGSLAGRETSAKAPVDDAGLESALLSGARAQGLGFREYQASVVGALPTVAFDYPGCSQPMLVTWRPATFEDEAAAVSAPREGYQRLYVYFDRRWSHPDRWAVSMQRIKYGLLAVFARSDYLTSDRILQIDAPRACPAAESMDWRWAWSRTGRN